MNRPKGLTLTAIFLSVCNAMLWATIRPGRPPYSLRMLMMFTVVIGIGYFVIWSYWTGRNWARIGILLFSGGSIFGLLTWKTISLSPAFLPTPAHILLAVRAILGVGLLYYLNTRPVLEFFGAENNPAPPRIGWGRILYGLWIILSSSQQVSSRHGPPRSLNEAHSVVRGGLALTMVFVGACVIAWGIRASRKSPTMRPMSSAPTPDLSQPPTPS